MVKLKYLLVIFSAFASFNVSAQGITDHHTHIQDSALVKCLWKLCEQWKEPPTAKDSVILNADSLIAEMNNANITNAVILSCAYMFGAPSLAMNNEYELVKNENDWVAEQAALYPKRLKAYLSINPLKDYALNEIKRCASTGKFSGIKMHFTNSGVDLRDADQMQKLQQVFKLADSLALSITVHMRTLNEDFGAIDANIFINQLLVHTTHIKVQVAHMAGWGGYDEATDSALQAFINALDKKTISRKNIFFDVCAVLPQPGESWKLDIGEPNTQTEPGWNPETALINKLNTIGSSNILFGTDWPVINMKAYLQMLEKKLGARFSAQVLEN